MHHETCLKEDKWHTDHFNHCYQELMTTWSNVLLSYSVYIQPLKPGPKEVIDHGYTISTKEDGVLIVKNLKV